MTVLIHRLIPNRHLMYMYMSFAKRPVSRAEPDRKQVKCEIGSPV